VNSPSVLRRALGSVLYETHDENMISLVDQELVMDQTGISGTTWFLFKALKPGETQITFNYGHGGGGPAADTKEFHIEVEK
jgi:predicted secreted protein